MHGLSRSFSLLRLLLFGGLLFVKAPAAAAQAPVDAAARAAAIAPFLDEQTVAVARIDLSRIDSAAVIKTLRDVGPANEPQFSRQLDQIETALKMSLAALRGAGIGELFVVVSLQDVPQGPPFLVAPLKPGADAKMAASVLRDLARLPAGEALGNAAVVGTQDTVERLKKLQPTPRAEVIKGFQMAGDIAAQVVFSPTADTRRVLREMLPRLPDEVGGGSGRALAEGVQWAVLVVEAPPRLSLSLTIQSKDADAAAALRGTIVSGLALMRQTEGPRNMPGLEEVIRILTPQVKGDQLVIVAGDEGGKAKALLRLVLPALQASRTAAGRTQSMNNLKQIGLAMHMHHDVHGHLPPQAIRSKDGKPLLSWRVAVLPWLDADPLFKEFHLDEPWDSEHNKKLIEKMPAVFTSPALGDERRARGMTSYLVPLSKAPPAVALPQQDGAKGRAEDGKTGMVFDHPQGTQFDRITDGTSNTIMAVEVHPQSAVVWTKPDDLVVDKNDLLKGLRGQPSDGFNTLICDGSVRFIKNSLDSKILLHLLQMNDGNPVGEF
jgi:uncharacterized protein DUF1559